MVSADNPSLDAAKLSGYLDSKLPLVAANQRVNPECYVGQEYDDPGAQIRLGLLLEGFYNSETNTMSSQISQLLPDNQPFNVAPWNYNGDEQIATAKDGLIDWVLLVVRDKADPNTIITQKAVLLKEDGTLVDAIGNDLISFDSIYADRYYISIHQKSHLAILSSTPLLFISNQADVASITEFVIDDETKVLGDQQLAQLSSNPLKYGLKAGDFNQDGSINNLDLDLWAQNGAVLNQYLSIDADGNAIVNNKDYNFSKRNQGQEAVESLRN